MATEQKLLQDPEQLAFIHECLPQLVAGEYTVSADLSVNVAKASNADFETAVKKVWVGAPRFMLDEATVYTRYPPRDMTGHFETTLPQIVFNRRTLPWERTIDGELHSNTRFKLNDPVRHAPWMALLLFSEDEMRGRGNAADAIIPEKKSLKDTGTNVFVPEISTDIVNGQNPKLAPWEDINTTYDVIDVPLPLFKQVAPAIDDLPYLAHVRKVTVDESKERASIEDEGYFATLMGNRLPVRAADQSSAVRNTVFLVSLEGYHNYYTVNQYIENKGKSKVRLVVLQSWSFTVAAGKNFLELCEGLHVSPFKMNYPAGINEAVKKSYDYGYTLLPHVTRNGAQTYSWYRGPFNPNFLPANPKTKVYKTADEALRFDHLTGLVDISYAAAWQLGRLLALKDKTFNTALYQWKLQGKRKVVKTAAMQQISNLFPAEFSDELPATATLEDKMKGFLASWYNMGNEFNKTPVPFSNAPNDIQQQLNNIAGSGGAMHEIPQTITDWLGKLFLLEGVPVNYLIPHEQYLISREGGTILKEAVGTFYIDYDWIEALLGGALSIVATEDSVALLNMLKDGSFLPENIMVNKANASFIPGAEGEAVPLPKTIKGHITGFFLRSQLVSGWKGIKIFAKDETGSWMQHPLKIERLSDDIQLCVFSGKVQQLSFIQPPEGIHFGVDAGNGIFQKALRDKAGNVGQTTVTLSVNNGVLNLKNIAASITEKGTQVRTSAELAFQLLESPIIYTLDIFDNWNKD
ncbi:hypothetical protein [Chitinophaga filiformis]|uniref:Uncharacterized protein n=1 Tax=Chitinophaga filiformis TaxID=104663 RepID=A0A1G7NMQ1_CHIFI|nr:hypothetical protein [Chitinophaga filiformis]SDF75338.1 hypothetical protein SAMN04488121_102865 [Chitinophaga filiformis]